MGTDFKKNLYVAQLLGWSPRSVKKAHAYPYDWGEPCVSQRTCECDGARRATDDAFLEGPSGTRSDRLAQARRSTEKLFTRTTSTTEPAKPATFDYLARISTSINMEFQYTF